MRFNDTTDVQEAVDDVVAGLFDGFASMSEVLEFLFFCLMVFVMVLLLFKFVARY